MGKLTFKGDKPAKKKKHSSSRHSRLEGQDEESTASGWTRIPSPALALGPTYITLAPTPLTSTPICVALQPTTGKIYAHQLPVAASSSSSITAFASSSNALSLDREDLEAIVDISSPIDAVGAEGPQDVHHVFVCTRVPDTDDRVTFRTATGKFLACDDVGALTADREARGFQEEWTLEPASAGTYLVRSPYGKLLTVDVLAGGKVDLRADEDNESETERWTLWMQAEYVAKAKKALIDKQGLKAVAATRMAKDDGLVVVGNVKSAEIDNIRKFQARGQGRLVDTAEDTRDLKRARKEGKLAEAMLDRRMKLKSDRYC